MSFIPQGTEIGEWSDALFPGKGEVGQWLGHRPIQGRCECVADGVAFHVAALASSGVNSTAGG
jgi:hypothetical protein